MTQKHLADLPRDARPDPVIDLTGVKAVCFDLFGTLLKIGERRRPFLHLYELLQQCCGHQSRVNDSTRIMSANVGLTGVPGLFGLELPASLIAPLEIDLFLELSTVSLFPEVLTALEAIRQLGLKMGLCSNLAAPYAVSAKLLLPPLDAYAWSFEVGAVKPAPEIYLSLCEMLQYAPHEVLMIGDTLEADYFGPRRVGMRSIHLSRDGASSADCSIANLGCLVPLIDRGLHE